MNNNFSEDQLFRSDGAGLNFRMLPPKNLASKGEASATEYKKNKKRLIILSLNPFRTLKVKSNHIRMSKKLQHLATSWSLQKREKCVDEF